MEDAHVASYLLVVGHLDIFPRVKLGDGSMKAHQTVIAPGRKQNGVKVPSIGGKCHDAWKVFDSLTVIDQNGNPFLPTRKKAIATGVVEGLNAGNLATEWHYWRKFNGFPSSRDRSATRPR